MTTLIDAALFLGVAAIAAAAALLPFVLLAPWLQVTSFALVISVLGLAWGLTVGVRAGRWAVRKRHAAADRDRA